MKEKDRDVLLSCPLFAGCTGDEIAALLDKCRAYDVPFEGGETIPFRSDVFFLSKTSTVRTATPLETRAIWTIGILPAAASLPSIMYA